METKIAIQSLKKISRQRNLFLGLSTILGLSTCALSLRVASIDERIIMVPGIRQTIAVSGAEVSTGYLEEMTALVFLPGLLDLNPKSITYKRDLILKYTAQSSGPYMKAIIEYFASAKERYTKFDLSTHFTVKNMEIDKNNLKVVANGILTSIYGKRGLEIKQASYLLSYEFKSGQLRLKEFTKVIDEEVLSKTQEELDAKEIETQKILGNAREGGK